MNEPSLPSNSRVPGKSSPHRGFPWLLGAIGLLVLFLLVSPRAGKRSGPVPEVADHAKSIGSIDPPASAEARPGSVASSTRATAAEAAEQLVAQKLRQFAQSRREFAHALAKRHGVTVSEDVEAFFAAVESGDWVSIEQAFARINGGDSSAGHSDSRPAGIERIWPAIIDTYGVAEQVHDWPAQELLDYGNAVLGALRPGMVYVGGTDNGRWIPELLNDTSDGERHIVLTQNGLADSSYLDYVRLLYEDRLKTLTEDDSQRAFIAYVADATRRLEHDEKFPDEPRKVLPGEEIQRSADGRVNVSGQVAVMAINERLLQALMAKNPDTSFALQESFPLRGTYGEAVPLGPLMELGSKGEGTTFTAERASETLAYWRGVSEQINTDPAARASESALKSYSHDTVAAANLLAARAFTTEAEQAYRLGSQVWPGNPEAVGGLADLLHRGGRESEARRVLEDFARQFPDQVKDLERVSARWHAVAPANSTKPTAPEAPGLPFRP